MSTVSLPCCSRVSHRVVNSNESRARDGSDIADPSLVSKGSAMPNKISRLTANISYARCASMLSAGCLFHLCDRYKTRD